LFGYTVYPAFRHRQSIRQSITFPHDNIIFIIFSSIPLQHQIGNERQQLFISFSKLETNISIHQLKRKVCKKKIFQTGERNVKVVLF
jgi:hypothetical protein